MIFNQTMSFLSFNSFIYVSQKFPLQSYQLYPFFINDCISTKKEKKNEFYNSETDSNNS